MAEEKLGMFGHHPDSIIDFEVEVECIQGLAWDVEHGTPTIGETADLFDRASKALSFRFVPGGPCQKTMETLRKTIYPLEDRLIAAAEAKP